MAGYTLQEHEPYTITGKTGKTYEIPAVPCLSVDEISYMVRFNESTDPVEKTKICKDFFLSVAPELEAEKIGDMEFFMIFEDYNKSARLTPKMGESSASRSSSRNTARRLSTT